MWITSLRPYEVAAGDAATRVPMRASGRRLGGQNEGNCVGVVER